MPLPETITVLKYVGYTLGTVLAGAVAAKKLPVSRKGKKLEASRCPDPDCHNEVRNTAREVTALRDDFTSFKNDDFKKFKEDVYPKINTTAESVARIEGFIQGLHKGK